VHPSEDALLPRAHRLRPLAGLKPQRARDHRREKSPLGGVEVKGRDSQDVLGRRLDAVDPISPLDDVEVDFQDSLLRERIFQPPGEEGFLELSSVAPLGREKEVLRELLGDGRRPADSAPLLPVALESPPDLVDVESFVAEEARVLAHEDGVDEILRDPIKGNPVLDALFSPRTHQRRLLWVLALEEFDFGQPVPHPQGVRQTGSEEHADAERRELLPRH
jgi:hypothetical protein